MLEHTALCVVDLDTIWISSKTQMVLDYLLFFFFLFYWSVSSGGQLQHHHRWDIDGQQRVRVLPVVLGLGDAHRQAHGEQRARPTVLQPELGQQQVSQTAHLCPVSWKDLNLEGLTLSAQGLGWFSLVCLHSTQCKHGKVIHFLVNLLLSGLCNRLQTHNLVVIYNIYTSLIECKHRRVKRISPHTHIVTHQFWNAAFASLV